MLWVGGGCKGGGNTDREEGEKGGGTNSVCISMNPRRPSALLLLLLSFTLSLEVDSRNKTVGAGVAVRVEKRAILSIIIDEFCVCEWRVEGVRMRNRWVGFWGGWAR